ncbi:MAG: hypothetical protein KAS04_05510 [Candidatus Aenigmarchaeota archaeon]|nr:hypothetical protein [Candidatus Aenigmarchaeota archaeon]
MNGPNKYSRRNFLGYLTIGACTGLYSCNLASGLANALIDVTDGLHEKERRQNENNKRQNEKQIEEESKPIFDGIIGEHGIVYLKGGITSDEMQVFDLSGRDSLIAVMIDADHDNVIGKSGKGYNGDVDTLIEFLGPDKKIIYTWDEVVGPDGKIYNSDDKSPDSRGMIIEAREKMNKVTPFYKSMVTEIEKKLEKKLLETT